MTRHTTHKTFEASSDQKRRWLRQEELILDVIERLNEVIESENISKTALADKLGCTKGFVSQILAGGRNLTLRTIADVADALGHEPQFQLAEKARASRVLSPRRSDFSRLSEWKREPGYSWGKGNLTLITKNPRIPERVDASIEGTAA